MPKENIEKTYQKKTPIEHIQLRPDTYIGSVQKNTANLWILNND
jgi:DNA topoisomerase-2